MNIDHNMSSVVLSAALDFFDACTVPVLQWLAAGDPLARHAEYIAACAVYAADPYADFDLRMQPHVAYDVVRDAHYFIFKQDNNGTCILVGTGLRSLFPPCDVM
jgi:hypothetical protein